jgi:spore coat polysaccharide biosynthesis predicted glycosyltransferase SpsG
MTVVVRADGGSLQGTGHLMRCLTLAEALKSRGHDVFIMTARIDVEWLAEVVASSGFPVIECDPDEVSIPEILALGPDWVVADSYRFDSRRLSELASVVPVLAIIDGDARGIEAELYLDQNLGAEVVHHGDGVNARLLGGAAFALVRDAVLIERRPERWRLRPGPTSILSFMGGSDPTGASVAIAKVLSSADLGADLTIIAPDQDHAEIAALFAQKATPLILSPTPDLPTLLGTADVVVSAAGTSAWDVCALGIPAVLVAVVDNQRDSLDRALRHGLALGIDASEDGRAIEDGLAHMLSSMLSDEDIRRGLSEECLRTFDGKGKERVVEALERHRATDTYTRGTHF